MSQIPEKVFIAYSLEELRCSLCTAYLSCAPIVLLSDGRSICGRCSVAGEEQTYRNMKLEAILSSTLFPCRYKKYGCEEHLVFGHTEEHEAKCDHYNLACSRLTDEGCAWEGSALQILDHFTKNHPTCAVENAEFIIQIDQDAQGLLVVPVNNVTFALKYKYTAGSSNLQYYIKSLTHSLEASYKIKFINDADQDYYIGLKGGDCLLFNAYNIPRTRSLGLNNFLQNLNNPNLLKVAVDLSVITSNKNRTLANDLLQTVRCHGCQGYLIPPLFDCSKGVVCSNCSKTFTDSKPSVDNELEERVANANYPCNWVGCSFIGKAADFQHHVKMCSFRVYKCIKTTTCNEIFKQEHAIMHLQEHNFEYFRKRFVYKLTFKIESAPKIIFTLKNDGIVSIQYETLYVTEEKQHRHEMTLNAVGTDLNKLALKVQYGHEHCKLKSKLYSLAFTEDLWWFYIWHLPACFDENEELTVTLEVGNKE